MTQDSHPQEKTLFGHPVGLYTLFFAEMWERFSYYGMRALLVFYMIKGFLGLKDNEAYGIYGAYTSLVYATPFIGGMLADKIFGARKSVVLGSLLMAMGLFMLTLQERNAFFVGLALLICGNGFFKPNISTMVGALYPKDSPQRDGGFTIFYMGINLGAAMSPLICGYVGETFGWQYGFGLAGIGMLVGLAIFIAPTLLTQILIGLGALGTATSLFFLQNNPYQLTVNILVALALLTSASVAVRALGQGGLPADAGRPRDPEAASRTVFGFLRQDLAILLGLLLVIPIIAILVRHDTIAGYTLTVFGTGALIWLFVEAIRSPKMERERLYVVLILMFFSLLFWAFFEQAGSSVNNFTDRNVNRVFTEQQVTTEDVGKTLQIKVSQAQLGLRNGDTVFTLDQLSTLRDSKQDTVDWAITEEHVGMTVQGAEVPASIFQAANPIFILTFGLVFTGLWSFLGARGWEPSTPVKFAMGLLQLGLGFGALWMGAQSHDPRGMVAMSWLLLGYLLHTTGELCLSPVGLAMITRLSPARMVSTVMGAWFLATAFSNYLAAMIAQLTGVHAGEGAESVFPAPIQTVAIYGDVFGKIALTAIGSALICFAMAPLLKKWMHSDAQDEPRAT
jgi:POT family proton-dependent oligopeptide transporter